MWSGEEGFGLGRDVAEEEAGEESDAKPCFMSLFLENCIIYSN